MTRTTKILLLGLLAWVAILAGRRYLHVRGEPGGRMTAESERNMTGGASLVSGAPLQVGDRIPDGRLVNQEGKTLRLSALAGSVRVLAFLYTRCSVASMCPLATAKLASVHRELKDRGISGVKFLLISFDTRSDHPRRLKEYSELHGLDLADFTLCTGEEEEILRLGRAFNNYFHEAQPGVFEHSMVVSIVDRDGFLKDDFFGTGWEPDEVVEVLEKLASATGERGS